ncbi:MAG: SMP-30/gluconolactonase/LRE family protein [Burkholderiaceae bacterium]
MPDEHASARPGDPTDLHIERLTDSPDDLGESPLWDPREDCLWWIDGVAGQVRRKYLQRGRWSATESFEFDEHVGSIALRAEGGLVIALEHSIIGWNPDAGDLTMLLADALTDQRLRLNDGKTDRQGRFVCGGMGRELEPLAPLLQLNVHGQVRVLATGLKVSNGICFSPDGRSLYFADTPARTLCTCDYDPATGVASEARVLIDCSALGTGIDGATVDDQGRLWAALVRIGEIGCFAPDGRLLARYPAPVDLPSGLAFGGRDMRTLFLTSIRDSRTGRTVSRHPLGGHLFAIEGLDARGILETPFGADTGAAQSA